MIFYCNEMYPKMQLVFKIKLKASGLYFMCTLKDDILSATLIHYSTGSAILYHVHIALTVRLYFYSILRCILRLPYTELSRVIA